MRSEIGVWLSWLTWQNLNAARKNSPAYKAAQAKLKQAVGSPVDLPRCPKCVQSGGVFELSFKFLKYIHIYIHILYQYTMMIILILMMIGNKNKMII